VALNKPLTPEDKKRIESGLELDDGISKLKIDSLEKGSGIKRNSYQVTMHEGRNRQIRRTFKRLGYTVTFLERQSFGKYTINQLGEKNYILSKID
jgi:23S rRNA pseudouridine2605 synthase